MAPTQFRPVDVGREFHRSAAWVKLQEQLGRFPSPKRDFAGRRFYTAEDVEQFRRIVEGRRGAPA